MSADKVIRLPVPPSAAGLDAHGSVAKAELDPALRAQIEAAVAGDVGMTVTEIARELDTPVETIRSRLRVAMGQVRALLGALREEESP